MKVDELKQTFSYGMHGNGAYKGLRQTNTLEAMLYWYKKGVRIFEIDMAATDDEDYVAVAHYLQKKDLRRLEIFKLPEKRTKKWFMSQKLFSISTNGLSPLALTTIVEFLQKHTDSIVMLDLFGMFLEEEASKFVCRLADLVGDNADIWNRILIESYNMDMAKGIYHGYSKANIITCVRYEENENEEITVTPKELLDNGIHFISYPWYCTKKHPGELEKYSQAGITVFSRTKDNLKRQKLKRAGVNVNLIAQRYDGWKVIFQKPLYMFTYIKRVFIKIYIKTKFG